MRCRITCGNGYSNTRHADVSGTAGNGWGRKAQPFLFERTNVGQVHVGGFVHAANSGIDLEFGVTSKVEVTLITKRGIQAVGQFFGYGHTCHGGGGACQVTQVNRHRVARAVHVNGEHVL